MKLRVGLLLVSALAAPNAVTQSKGGDLCVQVLDPHGSILIDVTEVGLVSVGSGAVSRLSFDTKKQSWCGHPGSGLYEVALSGKNVVSPFKRSALRLNDVGWSEVAVFPSMRSGIELKLGGDVALKDPRPLYEVLKKYPDGTSLHVQYLRRYLEPTGTVAFEKDVTITCNFITIRGASARLSVSGDTLTVEGYPASARIGSLQVNSRKLIINVVNRELEAVGVDVVHF